jgi:hypothetical protein
LFDTPVGGCVGRAFRGGTGKPGRRNRFVSSSFMFSRSDGLDSEARDRDGDGGRSPVASKRPASLPAEVAVPRERRPAGGGAGEGAAVDGSGGLVLVGHGATSWWVARAGASHGSGRLGRRPGAQDRALYGPTEGARQCHGGGARLVRGARRRAWRDGPAVDEGPAVDTAPKPKRRWELHARRGKPCGFHPRFGLGAAATKPASAGWVPGTAPDDMRERATRRVLEARSDSSSNTGGWPVGDHLHLLCAAEPPPPEHPPGF